MKKLFNLLLLCLLCSLAQGQFVSQFPITESTLYFSNFDSDWGLNEQMFQSSGEIFGFDSTNIHLSFDGSNVFKTYDGYNVIKVPVGAYTITDSIATISMRVKKVPDDGCESSFVLEYKPASKEGPFLPLHESNPESYYHLIEETVEIENGILWFRFKSSQVEGCGSHYIDDVRVVTPFTPEVPDPIINTTESTCAGDFNEDGIVNYIDLLEMLSIYDTVCE